MKYLLPLVFAGFVLFAVPLAHADTTNTGTTCNPAGVSTCPSGFVCQATGGSSGICVQAGPTNTPSTSSGPSVNLLNPLNAGTSLPTLLTEILSFVIRIGTVIVVLMVVYVGFKFVMARGEPAAISEAREALKWTVVGALILLGAQAIASAIEATAQAL